MCFLTLFWKHKKWAMSSTICDKQKGVCPATTGNTEAFAFVLSGFRCTREDSVVQKGRSNMSSGAIIMLIVIVMLVAAIPSLPQGKLFRYQHSGVIGLALLILFSVLLADGI
jgi:Protein of unknown function (DUF3309)